MLVAYALHGNTNDARLVGGANQVSALWPTLTREHPSLVCLTSSLAFYMLAIICATESFYVSQVISLLDKKTADVQLFS